MKVSELARAPRHVGTQTAALLITFQVAVMIASDTSLDLPRKIHQCIQQQQWHQAKHHCQRLLKLEPRDAQAHQLLGLIHIQLAGIASSSDSKKEHTRRAQQAFQAATLIAPQMFDAMLNLGNAHLQLHEPQDALGAYREALTLNPQSDLVFAGLAEAQRQLGHHEQAMAHLQRATELAPEKHGYWVKIGNILRELQRHEEAIACYEGAISLEPDQAEAYAQMSLSMAELGHRDAALGCCKIALEIDPCQATALHHRALIQMQSDDKQAALDSLNATLALQPQLPSAWASKGSLLVGQKNYAEALSALSHAIELGASSADIFQQRALCLQDMERLDEAINDLEKALSLDPQHALSLMTLGVISQNLNRYDSAIHLYTQAIQIDPQRVEAYSNLGAVLFESNRFEDARVTLEAAVELNPKLINAWINLGSTLMQLYRFEESLAAFEQVLNLNPKHVDALCHQGLVLHDLRRMDEALDCYERALAIDPDSTLAHWNKAYGLLLNGDLTKGWPQYESRWTHKKNKLSLPDFPTPRYTAQSNIQGKRLLVYAEQGLGDTLMFARFIPRLIELGAQVIFEVQPSLVRLMTRCLPDAQIIAMGQPTPSMDFHSPLLSLPGILGVQECSIPATDGYLSASSAKLQEWRKRLGPKAQRRIGLVWSGNAAHQNDRNRSMSLKKLLDALPKEFEYISLQNQIRQEDLVFLKNSELITSFADEMEDFEDTAALCQSVDLVISVDTSVAHLSAALGVKTWTLVPYSPDWRWMLNRADTPWYKSMRLFRQTTPGSWDEPLSAILTHLIKEADLPRQKPDPQLTRKASDLTRTLLKFAEAESD